MFVICDIRTKTKPCVLCYQAGTLTRHLADCSHNSTRSSIIPDLHFLADNLLYTIYLKSKSSQKVSLMSTIDSDLCSALIYLKSMFQSQS